MAGKFRLGLREQHTCGSRHVPAVNAGYGQHIEAVHPCFDQTVVKFWCRFFKSDRVQGRALRSFGRGQYIEAVRLCSDYTVLKFRSSLFIVSLARRRLAGCPNRKRFDAEPCEALDADGTPKLSTHFSDTP